MEVITLNGETGPYTSDGTCTIREAILSANNGGSIPEQPDDPIPTDCQATVYDPNLETGLSAVELFPDNTYAVSEKLPIITGNVLIRRNPGLNGTAIIERSNGAASFGIFKIASTGILKLDNVIISNGYTVGNGGGILNAGTLILNNSAVAGNYAEGDGGGIYNTGVLTAQNSIIQDNIALGLGSGLYNEGSITPSTSTTGGCFTGNAGISVHTTASINLQYYWWGSANGPSGEGTGSGDAISTNVAWDPPLGAAPTINGVSCDINPEPSLPECPELENIYATGFDPNQNNSNPWFETYLVNPNTPSDLRQSCWRLYEDIIFLAMFHELADDDIISWNEFNQLNGATYASFISGFQRNIATDGSETSPFTAVNWDPQWDHRYLFARTIINGMSDEYASLMIDPMRYFARNYSETVSNNWMNVTPFCGGSSLTSFESLPPSCLLRDWYAINGVQNYRDGEIYSNYIDIIRTAIQDEITRVTDPTDEAFGARPANRRWGSVVQGLGLGPHDYANPPHPPFVFQAHVGQIVKLQWSNVTFENNSEWYPSGIWTNGIPTPVQNLPGCVYSAETIPQAYMRHLRELFNLTAQNDLLNGNGRTSYSRNDTRFGIPGDPRSTSATGIHAHVLWPSWSNDILTSLRWYTFRFTRPLKSGETLGTRPLFGNEYIIDSSGNVVTSTTSGVLQPVECP
jgi:hypothetical protein